MSDIKQNALRPAQVLDRVPFSRSTLYRLIEAGDFPKPFKLSKQCVAFLESDVNAWLEKQAAESQCGNECGNEIK